MNLGGLWDCGDATRAGRSALTPDPSPGGRGEEEGDGRILTNSATGLAFQGLLSGGEFRDRDAEGAAADVVEAELVAEHDGRGFAAVFAADAELELGAGGPAVFAGDLHQAAHAGLVDLLERVIADDVVFAIQRDERPVVVAAHAEGRLGQVVGPQS